MTEGDNLRMELLIAVLARMHLVVDTMKNVPGMMNARLYAGKEGEARYFKITLLVNTQCSLDIHPDFPPQLSKSILLQYPQYPFLN